MLVKETQKILELSYDKQVFVSNILQKLFNQKLKLFSQNITLNEKLNKQEQKIIHSIEQYGTIIIKDQDQNEHKIFCYQINLQKNVKIERNKIAIQQCVRKLLGKNVSDSALVSFIPENKEETWRLTFITTDNPLGGKKTISHPKRYTYLLGKYESCKTLAERFVALSNETEITNESLKKAFSVEKLSNSFFAEYKIHYEKFIDFFLKSNFKKSVFNGNEKSIRDFCKKLLGRIVFLYFLQKKGWLGASNLQYEDGNKDFMMNFFKNVTEKDANASEGFYSNYLTRLFFEALNTQRSNDDFEMPDKSLVKIPFLNGGLFDKDEFDDKFMTIDGNLFHADLLFSEDSKTRGFLDFLNAYNFTIHEDSQYDHTVAVDPEMLGHIFENLLEDNKDKGAFYTPKEIVQYMCQESITTHIVNNLSDIDPKEIEDFVKNKNTEILSLQNLETIKNILHNIKICDPAIGSGAFPMGLLQEISAIYELIAFQKQENWLPALVKKNIIQNNIYGVDIEKGAVDIARLRFWLSLIIDEDTPKALPNLDYKIVLGNSLVSKFENQAINIDWSEDNIKYALFGQEFFENNKIMLKKLTEIQKDYYQTTKKQHKKQQIKDSKIDILAHLFENLVKNSSKASQNMPEKKEKNYTKALQIHLEFLGFKDTLEKIQKLKKNTTQELNFFDWKLDFADILNPFINKNDGFDIIIGNPPYIQIQKLKDQQADFEKQKFETYTKMGDIYCLFYEKGMQLLKDNGILAYITSNKWMRAGYGESIRDFFVNKNPLQLVDFGGVQVFESATVDTNILIIQKAPFQNQLYACTINKTAYENVQKNLSLYFQQHKQHINPKNGWNIAPPIAQSIKQKIERIGTPLKDWDISIYRGILTGFNEAFIIDEAKKNELIAKSPESAEIIRPNIEEVIRPILRGRDIKRYSYDFAGLYLICIPSGWTNKHKQGEDAEIFFRTTFPSIYEHLQEVENNKTGSGKGLYNRDDQGQYWWELRSCVYMDDFNKEKIAWNRIANDKVFSLIDKGVFISDSMHFFTGNNLVFLNAILNSKLFSWLLFLIIGQSAGGNAGNADNIKNLCIPKIPKEKQKPFEDLVNKIFESKEKNEDTTIFEKELDTLIYQLYELTNEEIGFLEK